MTKCFVLFFFFCILCFVFRLAKKTFCKKKWIFDILVFYFSVATRPDCNLRLLFVDCKFILFFFVLFLFFFSWGNEFGQDSKTRTGKGRDTPQQARERKEINKSLLSLKECIRGLHSNRKHISFRNSKLTMVLRPHLKGENSTAIMIANVSSSQNDITKTVNTLQYSQLVAQA